jgi:hypothetical protein
MPIPFRPIARLLAASLRPAPALDFSSAHDLFASLKQAGSRQSLLVTVNHYHAPDFQAWWFAILVSAIIPTHVHWVVTSGWTGPGWLPWLTHWLFPLGARLLGFTSMPAMPPAPAETEARAAAVRRVLHYASHHPQPVIGLSPEGMDTPGGVLGSLPAGVGRFVGLISRYCPNILPVGVWKESGVIHVKFGSPYRLEIPSGLSAAAFDHFVGETIMHHIAQCLPDQLKGEYR